LPIDTDEWNTVRKIKFFDQARGSGRPVPPSILVLKIPHKIKQRLLRLLENSYGYTSETMYPDLSGFASANGWQRPLRRDRRPNVPLTESFLPVAIDLGKGSDPDTSVKDWSSARLLRAARRELSISKKRIDLWLKEPTSAPQYWAVYHAGEVIGVFKIDKGSWHPSGHRGRYICDLSEATSPDALAVLGCSFVHNGEPMPLQGRGFFVGHTKPRV
jgi:hypothetical protein